MTSYLQQLENNEAILLMYLAGELPESDRAEVEQMLGSDARLRADLAILRQTQELAFDALESLDELPRPRLATGDAENRVVQLVGEWARRRRGPGGSDSGWGKNIPWRRIGFAAAASLMLGYYIWLVYTRPFGGGLPSPQGDDQAINSPDQTPPEDEIPSSPAPRVLSSEEKVALLSSSLEESNSEDSNLHVAEVAAVVPSDAENGGDSSRGADLNTGGNP